MATEQTLRRVLTDWLALTRDMDLPTGLSRDVALARARLLRKRILAGNITPEELEIDEEGKDVLYALVELLKSDPVAGPDPLREPNAVYQFIRLVAWSDDELQERHELLQTCAEIGWQSMGLSLSAVTGRRISSEPPRVEIPQDQWSEEFVSHCVSNPELLRNALRQLRRLFNDNPSFVAEKASALWRLLVEDKGTGLFDERAYVLGEAALLVAGSVRHLGKREETEIWLNRAMAGFRYTMNPEPLLARCSYTRLALEYDRRRHREVLALLPVVLERFEEFGMRTDLAKARFLEAMTLKACSRQEEAYEKFAAVCAMADELQETALRVQGRIEIGSYQAWKGRYDEALDNYHKAMLLLSRSDVGRTLAVLKLEVGEMLRFQGHLSAAVEAYREGIVALSQVGMVTYVAYSRIILAEALIDLGRHREAESEILAALPTIEEQKMIPEGFHALALLRESVRARKTDPDALRELREHLKGRT